MDNNNVARIPLTPPIRENLASNFETPHQNNVHEGTPDSHGDNFNNKGDQPQLDLHENNPGINVINGGNGKSQNQQNLVNSKFADFVSENYRIPNNIRNTEIPDTVKMPSTFGLGERRLQLNIRNDRSYQGNVIPGNLIIHNRDEDLENEVPPQENIIPNNFRRERDEDPQNEGPPTARRRLNNNSQNDQRGR